MASRVLDTLPSLLAQAQHDELWGIDLKTDERQVVGIILEKVLESYI